VAIAGGGFRGMHVIVDIQVAAGKRAEFLADALEGISAGGFMDQPGTGDRARIDHRIERLVVVGQPDRIERLAAGLDADRRRDTLLPDEVKRQRENERLGDGLNGERHGAIADLVDMPVDGDERDPEMRRVGPLQLGNIVGERARMISFEFLVAAVQEALERRLSGISSISGGGIGHSRTARSTISPCFGKNKQSLCH
jgi:hypothetical protein